MHQLRAESTLIFGQAPHHIEANDATFSELVTRILGPSARPCTLVIHAGMDGSVHQACNFGGGSEVNVIHAFNPTGVHYDPLWRDAGGHSPQPAARTALPATDSSQTTENLAQGSVQQALPKNTSTGTSSVARRRLAPSKRPAAKTVRSKCRRGVKRCKAGREKQVHHCSLCGEPGHRRETCPSLSSPRKKKTLRPSWQPSYSNRKERVRVQRLARLLQVPYPQVCSWSESRAKSFLRSAGCIPSLANRRCWKCGSALRKSLAQGPKALRCHVRKCGVVLRDAEMAYTPLAAFRSAHAECSWADLARAMYLLGDKVSPGQAVHLGGLGEYRAMVLMQRLRVACAFCELHYGEESELPAQGTLEFDASRTALVRHRDKGEGEHIGRMLVSCHRESGERFFTPLPPRTTQLGARPPPERNSETWPVLQRHVKETHLASTDSGRSFVSFFAKRPAAAHGTVAHNRKQYTRLTKIPLAELSPELREYAASLPSTSKSSLRFTAGDQQAGLLVCASPQ